MFDVEVMAADMDDSERELEARRVKRTMRAALHEAFASTLHQGARRGIHAITASPPNEDDVVFDAVCEFEKMNQDELSSPLGMAYRLAFQRGRNRGRKIIQRRVKIDLFSEGRALYRRRLGLAASRVPRR